MVGLGEDLLNGLSHVVFFEYFVTLVYDEEFELVDLDVLLLN